ncbi:hypothetical protein F4604DRAFT_1054208 [Suillus subluteus]|nr:hypothetical protein F4604DRAFT_1054208 [Suillus subluteus]
MSGTHPHSSANALLARLFSLLRRFRSDNAETTELPPSSRPLVFHLHTLAARLSSLIHSSPPENNAPNGLEQHSRSQLDPHVLLARPSSLPSRSRLGTDKEAEPHSTTPLISRPDALTSRLSSLFRSQPHTNEEIELLDRLSRPRIVEVAAIRDKQV